MKLRNKFIQAPLKLGYSDGTGIVTPKHINFYTVRARHIGAIALEPLYLDKSLRELPTQLGIDSDEKIEGLARLNQRIHEAGAKVIAHLNHPGRMANPKIPGNAFYSSVEASCENGGATPKMLNKAGMGEVKSLFLQAVQRAQKADFDIIELQFGHGYLVAQFISEAVNTRTDEYGGSFENRVKFPLEILDAVQAVTALPIIVRISGDEMVPDGIHLPEMIRFSKLLKEKGVEAIHVSAGTVCSTPPWFFQHMFVPKGKTWQLASELKKAVGIPVIFVGRINSAEDIKLLQNEYEADYIAVGRAQVADPDFVGKYQGLVAGNIKPCLACSEGCLGGVKSGKGLGCVVNPLVGKDDEQLQKTTLPKFYGIVGGGLAGMQAAVSLHEKGHKVELYEKEQLGGQFNLAYLPPKKESLQEILDYFKKEINERNISVFYKEAEPEELIEKQYDGVILATGAIPAVPPIKGLQKFYWTEFLQDSNLPQDTKVLVIGGGLIGLEVASKLVEKNNRVVIVEMLDEVARGMEMIEKKMTLAKLKKAGVEIYTNHKVVEIDDTTVTLEGEISKQIQGIEKVVVATGMESYNPLEAKLKGKLPVYTIGDARQTGKAQQAIREGFEIANQL